MEERKTSGFVIALMSAALGVAVGYGAATLAAGARQNAAQPEQGYSQKEFKFRYDFSALSSKGVNLLFDVARLTVDGSPQAAAALGELSKNSQSMKSLITGIYGEESAKKLYDVLQAHNQHFVSYASAVREGKKTDIDKAASELEVSAESLASLWFEINPNINKQDVLKRAKDHIASAKSSIDSYIAKNYLESYASEAKAGDQMEELTQLLADAIATQRKEKF